MTPGASILKAIKEFLAANHEYAGLDAVAAATLLNRKRSQTPPVYRVRPLTKGEFMLLLTPAVLALSTAQAATQAKWGPLLDLLKASPESSTVDVTSARIQTLTFGLVTDGLLAADAAMAVLDAGRVEDLKPDAARFGYSYLSEADVRAAMNS